MLDRILQFLEKLINYFAAFSIGYGLADRKRRELEAINEEHKLKDKLEQNEKDVDKLFDGADADHIIRTTIRSKRNH